MAKAAKKANPVVAILVVDKDQLRAQIEEREKMGQEILNRAINSKEDKQLAWDDFIRWNKYNEELIKQAFNDPDNSYAAEYKYKPGIDPSVFYRRTEKTFQEHVEDDKRSIAFQLKKLRWFHDKIDLLRAEKPAVQVEDNRKSFLQLVHLLTRFHKIAQAIRHRYANRETLLIRDEYDVQDLLYGVLQVYFDDIRKEESSPSSAGANTRLDFVLRNEKLIVEIKMTSENYTVKKLGEDLLVGIGRYKAYPGCTDLIIFIYDKGDHIRNKRGFISDLEKQSTHALKVSAIINPE